MAPNQKKLAQLQALDLGNAATLIGKPNVIELSSRNEKPQTIVAEQQEVDPDNYWNWPAERDVLSTAEIEKSLVADAARRNEAEQSAQQEQQSVDYWTWESPKDANARQAKQEEYWQWEEKTTEQDLFSAATIERNLMRASEELANNNDSGEECSSSDDYWSWEGPKRRQDRLASTRRPVNTEAFSVDTIEARLVSESKQRTIVEEPAAMSQEDSYWYWEEKPDVLSTQATVNRLMEHAKVTASQQEDYWKWNARNDDILSGAAIERSLVLEQKRRENDAYWAWGQGDEVKYSLANAARCSDAVVVVEQEQPASYWVW